MIKFKTEKNKEQPETEQKNIFFVNLIGNKKKLFKVEKELNELEEDKKKKPIKFVVSNFQLGHWSIEEHKRFIRGIVKYGKNWERVKNEVQTRSDIQIRSHAQKFYKKLKKCKNEQLGIDFTLDTIHNFKDMIDHVNSVNNNYDMKKIFLYLPGLCKIKETTNPDSEDEENNYDKYDDLFNETKKEIIKKDINSFPLPQIQNINDTINNILFINYINNINNDLSSFIQNLLVNQIATNHGLNQILSNITPNLNNYNINNLPHNILNNDILFNNININNNINNTDAKKDL